MKHVTAILCLLLTLNVLAQNTDTVHLQFHDKKSLSPINKPLLVLDGIPYSGIPNPDDIKEITLLDGRESVAMYGSQAALGVIFIITKNFKGPYKKNPEKTEDLFVDTNALYVIDGKVSSNKLNGIDVQELLSVNILKSTAKDPSLYQGVKSEVIVVTNQGAIKSYQKKLSAFSKKYEDYIENHSGDSQLIYLVNGVQISANTKERIRSLYGLKADSIKNIVFTSTTGQDSVPVLVVAIATK